MRIAVTCGDPEGIGPEVALAAVAALQSSSPGGDVSYVLLGPGELWGRAAALRSISLADMTIRASDPEADPTHAALPEVASIATAVRGCLAGEFVAVCTAPIHKGRLLDAGFPHPGHTGYLAALCGLPPSDAVMLFAGGALTVALVTTHIPLAEVPAAITTERVVRTARTAADEIARGFGPSAPRVAICGLNPHAGEGGALGTEDEAVIAPAVAALRAAGVDATGPHPADTIFARAARGEFDLVVAQYHDQGLIPVKTLDFGRSVNITAGLPIVRTSVDHGTARDIAWTGRADAAPMEVALRMAVRLAEARRGG